MIGAAGTGKSVYAQRLAYEVFAEVARKRVEIAKSYSIDPSVVDGVVDYHDGMLANTERYSYFPFTKISDDTNGVLGTKVKEESAVTAFHGRNENTSVLKFHQMNFKNFQIKHRLEIETGNVTVSSENLYHNMAAYSRRYHFVLLCPKGVNLLNENTEVMLLEDNCKERFLTTCVDQTAEKVLQNIESFKRNSRKIRQSTLTSLVANKIEQMYNYSIMNRAVRAKVIERLNNLPGCRT